MLSMCKSCFVQVTGMREEYEEQIKRTHPSQRWGMPQDIGKVSHTFLPLEFHNVAMHLPIGMYHL